MSLVSNRNGGGGINSLLDPPVYFVENLTIRSWIVSIWPRLLRDRRAGRYESSSCYFFEASGLALPLARITSWAVGVHAERLDYKLTDVTDDSGRPVRLRVDGQDLLQVQKLAMGQQVFEEAVQNNRDRPRLSTFLAKRITLAPPPTPRSLRRAIYMVHITAWQVGRNHSPGSAPVLFLERIPWLDAITPISADRGVSIVEVGRSLRFRAFFRGILPREMANLLLLLRQRRLEETFRLLKRILVNTSKLPVSKQRNYSPQTSPETARDTNYVAAVEYVGQLNLDRPERHSNLFFWQQSSLVGSDLLVTFTASSCPLDDHVWAEMSKYGMSVLATYPGATTSARAPVFSPPRSLDKRRKSKAYVRHSGLETRWLEEQFSDYGRLRNFWTALFDKHNVRVFVTYNKIDAPYCAIADAIQSLGGVSVNYERSYATFASPDHTASSDVMFNFSQTAVELEIQSGSTVRYHVVTGHLGDHRFSTLKNDARAIRDKLRQQGAKHVLAFFDEGSTADTRWNVGHRLTQDNYAFLLEKVLSEPWFGLVVKPKSPNSLPRRLGPLADLLQRAEATGRCYIFKEGGIQAWYPPSAAALAADLAVHGHLWAGTAGIESALAGVPTLLMDLEGWKVEPLYRLGVGRVVFDDWEGLWEACTRHWASPDGLPGFGDWSSVLDEMDPFRDGRAAERMGTYIQWLLEGFRAGFDRDTVLANAAQRYGDQWGYDKVTQANGKLRQAQHTSPEPE